jgi:TRAP-type mannitol/chloroaromatic compound transport system permease small subunit
MNFKKYLKWIRIYLDLINKFSGYICAFLVCLMTINVFLVVLLRYLFGISFIWMQETYVWMHAFIFMLGSGFTYLMNEHVRIDIFYREASSKYKKIVNLIGNLFFLLPFLYIIYFYSFSFVYKSFSMGEVSREAGGLGMIFILKSSILIFVILLTIQVLSKIITDFVENTYNDS